MKTWGGSRAVAAAGAGVLAATLAACNGGSSTELVTPPGSGASGTASSSATSSAPSTSETPTTASSSASESSTAPSSSSAATLTAAEVQAKIVAGTPPKDLAWRYPDPPSAWKKLKSDDGTLQWQVRGKCIITLRQPAGIGTERTPTSHQVLKHTAEQTAAAFPGTKPKYHGQKSRMVTNVIDGFNGTAKVQMQESLVDYGKVRSRIVAYRKGDFALTADSVCRDAKLFRSASKSDLDPFIDKLQARTTY